MGLVTNKFIPAQFVAGNMESLNLTVKDLDSHKYSQMYVDLSLSLPSTPIPYCLCIGYHL